MEHIVRFDEWCSKCRDQKVDETKDPCDECLSYPTNTDTTQPVLFKEKD